MLYSCICQNLLMTLSNKSSYFLPQILSWWRTLSSYWVSFQLSRTFMRLSSSILWSAHWEIGFFSTPLRCQLGHLWDYFLVYQYIQHLRDNLQKIMGCYLWRTSSSFEIGKQLNFFFIQALSRSIYDTSQATKLLEDFTRLTCLNPDGRFYGDKRCKCWTKVIDQNSSVITPSQKELHNTWYD